MPKINKQFLENVFSLIILQGSNYILPLITFPFLVRRLGTEGFGLVSFTTAIMYFFIVFTDYGFNITATKKISVNKENVFFINKIVNRTISIKLILMIISFFILLILISFVPKLNENSLVYITGFLSVLGSTIFPLWFFQGIQKMRYITIINIISKFFSTLLIFIFINNNNDIILAVFFQSLNFLLPGLTSLIFIRVKFNLKLKLDINISEILVDLKEGFYVFMTSIWVNVYVQGSLVITGFIAGDKAAGYYAIGQKLMAAMVGIMQPIGQAAYPYMCDLYKNNKVSFFKFRKKLVSISFIISAVSACLLFFFTNFFIFLVSGNVGQSLNILIKLFAISVLFTTINTQITQIMYAMNKDKKLQRLYLYTAILFLVISFPFTYFYSAYGMIISMIIIELTIFIATITMINNKMDKQMVENH